MKRNMRLNIIFMLTLSYLSISCGGQNIQTQGNGKKTFTQVAILCLPFPESIRDSAVYVYNSDMSIYTCFEYDSISSETRCDRLKEKIVAYYPSWDVMCFFYEGYNDKYCKIRVGEDWKLLRKELVYNVCELDSFLFSAEYWPEQNDSFYQDDLKTRKKAPNASMLKCNITKVMGDWLQVQDGEFKAWIKWKDGSYVFQDRLRFDI